MKASKIALLLCLAFLLGCSLWSTCGDKPYSRVSLNPTQPLDTPKGEALEGSYFWAESNSEEFDLSKLRDPEITELVIYAETLPDDLMAKLQLSEHITYLSLDGGDYGLAADQQRLTDLVNKKQLQELSMALVDANSVLRHLAPNPNLKYLSVTQPLKLIGYITYDTEVATALGKLTGLKGLYLHGGIDDEQTLETIVKDKSFESLSLTLWPENRASFTGDFLQDLPAEKLTYFSFSGNLKGFDSVGRFTVLESLYLSEIESPSGFYTGLVQLKELESLAIDINQEFNTGVDSLVRLPRLRRLIINSGAAHITDESLKKLASIKSLELLMVKGRELSATELKLFAGHPSLKDISVGEFTLDQTAVGAVELIPHLIRLDFKGAKSDQDPAILEKLEAMFTDRFGKKRLPD